jgi:hypothetical protein
MGDMQQPMMPPAQGYMGASKDPMRKNVSIMNPADLALMKQEGQFTPDMKLGDMLAKMGLDVNGPATQLVEFIQKNVQNADPLGKMQNIAADSMGGEEQMPEDTGLESLMRR